MTHPLTAALLGGLLAVGSLAAEARAQGSGSATLDAARGARCSWSAASAGNIAGFALPDSKGVMRGLDADSCRAVAAAVFGDANKVKFVQPHHAEPLHRPAIGRGRRADPQHHLDARRARPISAGCSPASTSTTAPASW